MIIALIVIGALLAWTLGARITYRNLVLHDTFLLRGPCQHRFPPGDSAHRRHWETCRYSVDWERTRRAQVIAAWSLWPFLWAGEIIRAVIAGTGRTLVGAVTWRQPLSPRERAERTDSAERELGWKK